MIKNLLLQPIPLITLLLPLSLSSEEIPAIHEYQVKAVFLSNFTKFVTWPGEAFPTATAPVSICILGEDPFLGKLDTILQGNTTQGRSLEIRYFKTVEMIKDCHILYISNSEQKHLVDIYASLQAYPILTVSDIQDSVRKGGMIEFYTRDSKVRFFVDPQSVTEAGLKISSRLLQIANVVSAK